MVLRRPEGVQNLAQPSVTHRRREATRQAAIQLRRLIFKNLTGEDFIRLAGLGDEEVWRTSKDKSNPDGTGRRFKIDTDTGEIRAGFGNKFIGLTPKEAFGRGGARASGEPDAANAKPSNAIGTTSHHAQKAATKNMRLDDEALASAMAAVYERDYPGEGTCPVPVSTMRKVLSIAPGSLEDYFDKNWPLDPHFSREERNANARRRGFAKAFLGDYYSFWDNRKDEGRKNQAAGFPAPTPEEQEANKRKFQKATRAIAGNVQSPAVREAYGSFVNEVADAIAPLVKLNAAEKIRLDAADDHLSLSCRRGAVGDAEPLFQTRREIVTDATGKPEYIHAELMTVTPKLRNSGLGSKIFEATLRMAVKLGLPIRAYAAGGFNDAMQNSWRGYMTWPLKGYTGQVPDDIRRRLYQDHAVRNGEVKIDKFMKNGTLDLQDFLHQSFDHKVGDDPNPAAADVWYRRGGGMDMEIKPETAAEILKSRENKAKRKSSALGDAIVTAQPQRVSGLRPGDRWYMYEWADCMLDGFNEPG